MNIHNIIRRMTIGILGVSLPVCANALESVEVRLIGRADAELQNSLQSSSVLKSLQGDADATAGDVLTAARSEYAQLVEVLYSKGYYSSVVSVLVDGREAALIDPFREPARVDMVQILVEPGRPFRFGKTEIGPLVDASPLESGFRTGAPALADVVRTTAKEAVEDWRGVGHAKAKITDQSVLARHGTAQLDVDVDIAPGPRAKFGTTIVTGDSAVRVKRVRAIAGLPSGKVFDPDVVKKAAARLRKVGTFKSVQVTEADEVQSDGTLDMQINVVDRKPRRIGGGLELSSLDGLTVSGYWLHRNIFGGAETLRVDSEIAQIGGGASGVDYSLSFRLEKPAVYGPDTLFFTEFGTYYTDEEDYLEKKIELTVGASHEFGERLTFELGIGYSYSRVTDLYATPNTERTLQLLSLPMALTYDARDDRLDATKGLYLKGEVTPFYETVQGQTGAHLTLDARGYHAVGGAKQTVLAGRFQLGSLLGPTAADAPPDFLFYSGGGGTVRGQPYQSLGATVAGSTLGGRSFAGLSGEVRHSLTDTIGLVAFLDAGYIGADGFSNGDWHAGAGLGLRYKTPVGPIRLDVAAPVAGDTGSGVQIYVGIGQAF
ncbi:autotransporter secretion outer membrane protein TamA [Litoreibacter meonggei]|uniref:Autotransporter secretion outer membrane protein TamA n=1 Tax=Litoreibacter meonggei TaxID=1049199 RepID=A0A497WT92_9RHOB|nr:autotransporter assembly complex family protein [Litoreibacter meonggei]RLJ58907.1 autotransporter secretion outer membrane protein TamA [Litoreibacter meonggei]